MRRALSSMGRMRSRSSTAAACSDRGTAPALRGKPIQEADFVKVDAPAPVDDCAGPRKSVGLAVKQHPPNAADGERRVTGYKALNGKEFRGRREAGDLVTQRVNLAPSVLQAVLKLRNQLDEISSNARSPGKIRLRRGHTAIRCLEWFVEGSASLSLQVRLRRSEPPSSGLAAHPAAAAVLRRRDGAHAGELLLSGRNQGGEPLGIVEEVVGEEALEDESEARRVIDSRVVALGRPARDCGALDDRGEIPLGDQPLQERRDRGDGVLGCEPLGLLNGERTVPPDVVHEAPFRGRQSLEGWFHRRGL